MFNKGDLLKHVMPIPTLQLGTLGIIPTADVGKLMEYSKVVSNADLQEARDKVARSRKRVIRVLEYNYFRRSEAFVALKSECSRRVKENIFIEKTPERTLTYRRNLPKCFRQPIAP